MSLWEYKVITSGRGGFASPALMEKFLNDLGKEEWEIISFHSSPDNTLAFTGLARRSTQRDWTLADAAATAAKAEADKLRQEFEAKFKGMSPGGAAPSAEEKVESPLAEKVAPDDGLRRLVDTSHDDDPDAPDDDKEEWDKLTTEEELPTFFEAIRPHLRRNQRGPGMSVGVDYLAKKWDQSEDDIKGALLECGFIIPEDEDSKPVYLEFDGDLYWLNINRRGELWLNTKEKPRPVFRAVQGQRVTVEEPEPAAQGGEKTENGNRRPERQERQKQEGEKERDNGRDRSGDRAPQPDAPAEPLPSGPALLEKIRPHMRRNRRGPGGSGSVSFLARALRCSEADLSAAFTSLGLMLPATPNDKSVFVEIDNDLWWLNQDSRGGVWINGREKREGETAASASASAGEAGAETPAIASPAAPESAAAVAVQAPEESLPKPNDILVAARLALKEAKAGTVAEKLERVAEETGKSLDDLLAALKEAGLKVPEKPREKPVYVERGSEVFWLNRNAKDELWLNAKASKGADDEGGRRGGRSKKKADSEGASE